MTSISGPESIGQCWLGCTDLYRCFMERTWRSMAAKGIVGLIHPESHFTELRAKGCGGRRIEGCAARQFRNDQGFSRSATDEPSEFTSTACRLMQGFLHFASVYHPDTVGSLKHDGLGPSPGVKDENDDWDLRPHREPNCRSHRVATCSVGGAHRRTRHSARRGARMLYPVNRASAEVLDKIAAAPRLPGRSRSSGLTAGMRPPIASWAISARSRLFQMTGQTSSRRPASHGGEAPVVQQPFAQYRSFNLTIRQLISKQSPRTSSRATNYQVAKPPPNTCRVSEVAWRASSSYFRFAWRECDDPANVRTLHAALLPPGPAHVGVLLFSGSHIADLCVMSGFAVPHGRLHFKVMGIGNVKPHRLWPRFPHPQSPPRTPTHPAHLRLNCLKSARTPHCGRAIRRELATGFVGLAPRRRLQRPRTAGPDVTPNWRWSTRSAAPPTVAKPS